jgi:hypothetical protein
MILKISAQSIYNKVTKVSPIHKIFLGAHSRVDGGCGIFDLLHPNFLLSFYPSLLYKKRQTIQNKLLKDD